MSFHARTPNLIGDIADLFVGVAGLRCSSINANAAFTHTASAARGFASTYSAHNSSIIAPAGFSVSGGACYSRFPTLRSRQQP
jgi:hypothetical protein